MDHTFAICAYKESPYLESCIRSVVRQSEKSRVIICTSTPNTYIQNLAEQYRLPYFVREGKSNIRDDWNFAYDCARTEYVTITHQDDIYHRDYLRNMQKIVDKHPDTLMAMTDYQIINEKGQVRSEISLLIKKIMRFPLRIPGLPDKKWVKKLVLSFGNPICCPSVCYHKILLGDTIFDSQYQYALDWEMSYKISQMEGRFTDIPQKLFYYRIHDGATTKKCLVSQEKVKEETEMFSKFWPGWMVKILMHFYKLSYKSYEK